MGQRKIRRWVLGGVIVATLGLSASASAPAAAPQACANAAPCNDNYLSSLVLNAPGTRLNRTSTLKDVRNTSTATVQANVFNPCGATTCPQGPPETTSCGAVSYGKTIWYDLHPDTAGTISVRTSGFDNVITLYRYSNDQASPSYLVPDSAHRVCVHQSSFPSEELVAPVQKGASYTVQIGGVVSAQAPAGAGGPLQALFDFFPKPPRRLSAQTTLTAKATSNGIQLVGLSVSTARAAKVAVDCGGFCRPTSKSKHATEQFGELRGTSLPAGSALTIRVTAPHSIGALIRYKVGRGSFTKQTFCTEPGSRKPRTKCH
jgi:hypothetical protein